MLNRNISGQFYWFNFWFCQSGSSFHVLLAEIIIVASSFIASFAARPPCGPFLRFILFVAQQALSEAMPSSWTSGLRSPVSPPAEFLGWFIGFVYHLLSNIMVCSRFVFNVHRFEYYSFFGGPFASLCGVGYCARVPLITNHSNHFGCLLRLFCSLGVGRGLAVAM